MPHTHAYGGSLPGVSARHRYGRGGRGVLGSQVPAVGEYGASPMYAGIDQATESNDEFRWWVSTAPSGGATIQAFEDGSFTMSVPGNGVYSFGWTAQKNGVTYGPATYTINVGGASGTAPGATIVVNASILPGLATGGSPGSAQGRLITAAASIIAGVAQGGIAILAPGALITATAAIIAGTASGGVGATVTVTLNFVAPDGDAQGALTGLKWAFYDRTDFPDFLEEPPRATGVGASLNSSGRLTVTIDGSLLQPGNEGWLILSNSDGTVDQAPSSVAFCAPVTVA